MLKKARIILSLVVVFNFAGLFCSANLQANAFDTTTVDKAIDQEVSVITHETDNLKPSVLRMALNAYVSAQHQGVHVSKPILTVIDYSLGAAEKRMWVVDLAKNSILFNTLVAHGSGSGGYYATEFSDRPGSLQSSLGLFLTKNTYFGHRGISLQIAGLDPGLNSNALSRRIVIHGAWYVSEQLIKSQGTVGRSWGCPAVEENMAEPIIDTIKDGTLVFAYYPSSDLYHSRFLTNRA